MVVMPDNSVISVSVLPFVVVLVGPLGYNARLG
jgi:hypothetical protein